MLYICLNKQILFYSREFTLPGSVLYPGDNGDHNWHLYGIEGITDIMWLLSYIPLDEYEEELPHWSLILGNTKL